MTTGNVHWIISTTRLAKSSDFGARFQTPIRQDIEDNLEKVYPDDGAFGTVFTLGTSIIDTIQVGGGPDGTDGDGNVLDVTLATEDGAAISFENEVAIDYHVALNSIERPQGIQINPRAGVPEYIETIEDIGEQADPDTVVDNGADITFRVNSVLESGVDHSGREVIVYMKIPAEGATTEAVAIETATVAYSAPNNSITTTGLLGQSSVSLAAGDYEVVLLGPTVRRNTDLSVVDGILYLGTVTGGGSGSVPSGSDTSAQTNINVNLSNFNNALDNFVSAVPILASRAGRRAPMTTPVERTGGVLFTNGNIYIMAGLNAAGAEVDLNQEYNPGPDTWTPKAVVPSQSDGGPASDARRDARMATVGTGIYLMGGFDIGLGVAVELVQRYLPGTDTWDAVRSDMPAARSGGGVGVIDGKIYYAGGFVSAGVASDDTYEYDPGLDSWTTVASIATASATAAEFWGYAVVNDKLYIMGGYQTGGPNNHAKTLVYDPDADTWTRLTDMPAVDFGGAGAVTAHAAAVVNNVIHIMGGNRTSGDHERAHLMYNVELDEYTVWDSMKNGGFEDAMMVADDTETIYVIGGEHGTIASSDIVDGRVSGYDASTIQLADNNGIASLTGEVTERDAAGWVTSHVASAAVFPVDVIGVHRGSRAVSFEGNIYISGGHNGTAEQVDMRMYSPDTNTFTDLDPMTVARAYHGMLIHENNRRMYVLHGGDGGIVETGTVEEYDPDTNNWTTIAAHANARQRAGYAIFGDEISQVMGDSAGVLQNEHTVYHLATRTTTSLSAPGVANHNVMVVGVPQRITDGGATFIGKTIYLMGGGVPGSIDSLQKWNPEDDTWIISSGGIGQNREEGAAVLITDKETGQRQIVIVGGYNGAVWQLNWGTLDPDDGTLVQPQTGSINEVGGRASPAIAEMDGRVFIFGGETSVPAELDTMEMLGDFADPVIPKLENISASEHRGPGLTRTKHERDTVAFKQNQIWGYGTWDAEAAADYIKIGEQ
jgi:hypothetical protein